MTDTAAEHEPEDTNSHERDLLGLLAAKNDRHRQTVEGLHGFEITDHQEDEHDD